MLSGDVNGDGREDLVLTGGNGWATTHVGKSHPESNPRPHGSIRLRPARLTFSRGDGTFHVTNERHTHFPSWTKYTGEQIAGVNGDDGKADFAVLGATGSSHVGVALSESTFAFNGLADLTQQLARRAPPCELVKVGRA
eukprot:1907457-Prymnesium_polylepis.2